METKYFSKGNFSIQFSAYIKMHDIGICFNFHHSNVGLHEIKIQILMFHFRIRPYHYQVKNHYQKFIKPIR